MKGIHSLFCNSILVEENPKTLRLFTCFFIHVSMMTASMIFNINVGYDIRYLDPI